ncbi:6576_t:CDS:2, partial [Dentiscutata heterogama]
ELLSVTYNKNEQYNGTHLNSLYLTGSLPTSPTSTDAVIPKCKEIVITCESHDQGWSSYPQDRGTYNNSWTWGEVSIITSKQNNNLQDNNWQVHKQEFFSDHPLVQSLQLGDIVGLWIRSEFPGWCNYIKQAEVKLYYTI